MQNLLKNPRKRKLKYRNFCHTFLQSIEISTKILIQPNSVLAIVVLLRNANN